MKPKQNFFQGLMAGCYDKTAHTLVAGSITLVLRFFISWPAVVFFLIALSIAKELSDWLIRKQKFDAMDILVNLLSMSVVLIVFELIAENV